MLLKLNYPKYRLKIFIYSILALVMIFVMPFFFRYGSRVFGLWLILIILIFLQLGYIWRVYSTRYLLLNQKEIILSAGWNKKKLWQKNINEITKAIADGTDLIINYQSGQFVIKKVKPAHRLADKINNFLQSSVKI